VVLEVWLKSMHRGSLRSFGFLPRPVKERCEKIGWSHSYILKTLKVHNAVPGDDEKRSPSLHVPMPRSNLCGGRAPALCMYDASLDRHWDM
jgi:hypothetical protein